MTRISWPLAAALSLTLPLAACFDDGKDDGTDTGNTSGADGTDGADGDDGDDGTDGASGPIYSAMTGSVTLNHTIGTGEDERVQCDATIDLVGTDNGDCSDCAFTFDIEATLGADSGLNCNYAAFADYTLYDPNYEVFLKFYDEYTYAGYYADYDLTNLLWVGKGYEAIGYPGPYFDRYGWLAYEYDEYGTAPYRTASVDGDTLTWAVDLESDEAAYTMGRDFCGAYTVSDVSEDLGGSLSANGDIACGAYSDGVVDIYEVTMAEAGTLDVTVDTADAETAADLVMWINGADSCVLSAADDQWACTFAPPAYECPASSVDVEAGTYQVVVSAWTDCADETTANYTLTVGGAAGIGVAEDDYTMAEGTRYQNIQVAGSATLTPM